MRISFLGTRYVVTIAVVLLILLNGMLLWRDYQNKKNLLELQMKLQNAQVELRVSNAIGLFGAAFVPLFNTVDIQGRDNKIPYCSIRILNVVVTVAEVVELLMSKTVEVSWSVWQGRRLP